MTLAPHTRTLVFGGLTALLAVFVGWQLGLESYLFPAFFLALACGFIAPRLAGAPLDAVTLGLLLFCYIVGNRGFAQQLLVPGLPLFPAEAGLGLCLTLHLFRSAWERRSPWEKDWFDRLLALWFLLGLARLAFDVKSHGFLALRDFATVYYSIFYFIARRLSESSSSRAFVEKALLAGFCCLLPSSLALRLWPDTLIPALSLRGIPVVYYKNDLVQTLLGAGSVYLFHALETSPRRRLGQALALALAASTLYDNSRAAVVGLGFACLLLAATRRFSYLKALGAVVLLGTLLLGTQALLSPKPFRQTPLFSLVERSLAVVLVDPTGPNPSEHFQNKADNNRFRQVWWSSVLEDTWVRAPLLGQGFGADLSKTFLQVFDFDLGEDFNARSPHNILLTLFGRMGLLGLALWLAIFGLWLQRCFLCLRRNGGLQTGLMLATWVVLVSACFGVVLEGPMAALPFWSMIGLASASSQTPA